MSLFFISFYFTPLLDKNFDNLASPSLDEIETEQNDDNNENDISEEEDDEGASVAKRLLGVNNNDSKNKKSYKSKVEKKNSSKNKKRKSKISKSRTQAKQFTEEKDILDSIIESIDEEFELSKQSDSWKEIQILKTLVNPEHPFSKFSIGNASTLKIHNKSALRRRLKLVYEKYFTPGNMKLVLYSNQDLDNLAKEAEKYFTEVRMVSKLLGRDDRYKIIQEKLKTPLFLKKQLSKFVWYEKTMTTQSLDFIFQVKEQMTKIYTKPYDYFTYMIKYSGENSLLQLLIKKNLAIKIDAGMIGNYRSFGLYSISVGITKEGVKQIEKVISLVYKYINKIKVEKPNKNIYNEIQSISEAKFFFNEDYSGSLFIDNNATVDKSSIQDSSFDGSKILKQLAKISLNMFDYDNREILISDYLHLNFEEKHITDFFHEIYISNCLIILGSPVIPNYFLEDVKNLKKKDLKN